MRATLRWIASNAPLMVLALGLAILAWVAAVEEADPTLEEPYPQLMPIALSGLSEEMVVVGEFDERADVTLRAPQSIWSSLEIDDFTVAVELGGLESGTHEVPVYVALNKQPSRVIQVTPEYVTLELAVEAERSIPVRVQVDGEPTLGYLMRALNVTPSQVTVRGPSAYVNQVAEASARISVQDANSDIEEELRLQVRDNEEQPVPYVTWTPEVVNVQVPV